MRRALGKGAQSELCAPGNLEIVESAVCFNRRNRSGLSKLAFSLRSDSIEEQGAQGELKCRVVR
jgi:hypothetical protein